MDDPILRMRPMDAKYETLHDIRKDCLDVPRQPTPGLSGDCWIWKGSPNRGYGRLIFKGKRVRVHHLAYAMKAYPENVLGGVDHTGEYGFVVDHRCEEKACCNPDHLQLVSNTENLRLKGKRKKESSPRLRRQFAMDIGSEPTALRLLEEFYLACLRDGDRETALSALRSRVEQDAAKAR